MLMVAIVGERRGKGYTAILQRAGVWPLFRGYGATSDAGSLDELRTRQSLTCRLRGDVVGRSGTKGRARQLSSRSLDLGDHLRTDLYARFCSWNRPFSIGLIADALDHSVRPRSAHRRGRNCLDVVR